MKVKILILGRSAIQADVPTGSTLQSALDAANVSTQGYMLAVNGVEASSDTTINDGDLVTCSPKIVGGAPA